MTSQQLEKICEKIESKENWFHERDAYAKGINPVIYQELPKAAPDFRISVPFARKAIQQFSGYMMRSGSITYSGGFFESTLKPIFDANDEELVSAMEFVSALKYGVTYELHYSDNNGKDKVFYPIPTNQGLPVYSTDLRPRLTGFYWLRKVEEECILTFYDATTQTEWRKPEKAKDWSAPVVVMHGYGQVPVNIGYISDDHENLFDHVKDLIDFYDKLVSGDIANESQRYVNALLLLADRMDTITTDESGRTSADRLREIMMLDGLGDEPAKKVAYLTKNIPTEFISFACKTIYDHIHDMTPMIDQRDDSLGQASGVAMEYRLLPFEYKAADIEANWSRFLQNRIYMIAGVTKGLGGAVDGVTEVQINFKRNLPKNLAEIADTMSKLVGLVSEETLLRLLPSTVVPDIAEELARIDATKPDMAMPVKAI